jgi:antitoxin component YwqK of YwqJK toxin-antitoxin module
VSPLREGADGGLPGSSGVGPAESPNALDEQGRKVGAWTEADAHGGVMAGEYVDGERHGTWRHLGADGRLRSEGGYAAGELDGPWVWYRASGALMQRGGFSRGEKHGLWERWNAAGEPLDSGSFDRGRKVGNWTVYNPDGSVRRTTNHRPAGA